MRRFCRVQLSLRVLLGIMAGAAVCMGWVCDAARRQQRAIEWVRSQGGEVVYEYQVTMDPRWAAGFGDARPGPPPDGWMPLPEAWKQRLGPDYEWSVVRISLKGSQSRDIATLRDLPSLMDLDLSGTKIDDLRPLSSLRKLRVLNLQNTPIADLSGIEGLAELRKLWLSGTLVEDLTPLTGLERLEAILLSDTRVTDLRPLARLLQLNGLVLNDSLVKDLRPLERLSKLEMLCLGGTSVTDLSPLGKLPRLDWLNVKHTNVRSLEALHPLTSLENLDICGTQVCDLTPLAHHYSLKTLRLQWTPVTTIEPLREIPGLALYHDGQYEVEIVPSLTLFIDAPPPGMDPPPWDGRRWDSQPMPDEVYSLGDSWVRREDIRLGNIERCRDRFRTQSVLNGLAREFGLEIRLNGIDAVGADESVGFNEVQRATLDELLAAVVGKAGLCCRRDGRMLHVFQPGSGRGTSNVR